MPDKAIDEPDYKFLFEKAPGLFLVLRPDLRIINATDAYLQATLTRREEIIGRYIFDVFPDNPNEPGADAGRNALASFQRVLRTGETDVMVVQRHDVHRPESEGGGYEVRYWSPINSPILNRDGSVAYIFHRVEDVTEYIQQQQHGPMHVKVTEELRERTERMEADLYARSREVAAANLKLKQINEELMRALTQAEATRQELEAFSYSVSHDLRAPLRSIDGFSRILLEKYADQIDAGGQNYLMRVRNAAIRMNRLIDDLLKLSRIGRAELKWIPVNLSDLAAAVIADLRQRDPERQVLVEIHSNLNVTGDPDLLRIVLENLLGNAWKFTSKTAEARIEVGMICQDGEPVYVVRDNGAGFDMNYADKLFTPFQRLHTEEEFSGTGIGLAIVQRIIIWHGGRVWAEGREGQGATVFFTLGEALP